MTKGNNNLLRPAIQQSSDCDCHSGLQARMSLNAIFVVARKVLNSNPASQAFPPCGSAKCASTLCSRSAASVPLSTFSSTFSVATRYTAQSSPPSRYRRAGRCHDSSGYGDWHRCYRRGNRCCRRKYSSTRGSTQGAAPPRAS